MKQVKKEKILFVAPSFQSFVLNDIKILEERYHVLLDKHPWQRKLFAPYYLCCQFFHLLVAAFSAKFIVVSFGGYWSYLPALLGKIYGKQVFIILHGTDCASIPEICYGSLRIPLLRYFCKRSYEMATCLLPVSESLIATKLGFNPAIRSANQGILNHFPGLKTPYHVIHNGLDADFWQIDTTTTRVRRRFFAVISSGQYALKGADLIVATAPLFIDCHFYIAGMGLPTELKNTPENVTFLGKLNPKDLLNWYQSSTFYLQLSSFEGFGCALVEAMLCGCIPIGSNVNHIPQIIGKSGFILEKKEVKAFQALINQCLEMNITEELHEAIRKRMADSYTLSIRSKKLHLFLASN
jgi:glycosyltransferase involved in cell wall biosynthesis